jgi:hypothetical protein
VSNGVKVRWAVRSDGPGVGFGFAAADPFTPPPDRPEGNAARLGSAEWWTPRAQMADRASRPADVGVMAAQGIRRRSLPRKLTIDAGEMPDQGTELRGRMIGASPLGQAPLTGKRREFEI